MEKYFATAQGPTLYAAAWFEAPSLLAAKRLATREFAGELESEDHMRIIREDANGLKSVAYRYPNGKWIALAA